MPGEHKALGDDETPCDMQDEIKLRSPKDADPDDRRKDVLTPV